MNFKVKPDRCTLLASTCTQQTLALPSLIMLLLAGLAWSGSGCAQDASRSPREIAPVAVRIAPVTRQDLSRRVGYVGTVHSHRELKVLARTSGKVTWLAGEGETVRKGQLLSRIEAPETSARASRMDAEVQRAVTERDFLCETYQTDRRLGQAGAVSSTQVDRSRRACVAARAAVEAARAGLREAGVSKSRSSEQAPFGGRVLRWLVEPGQNVMPGTPLLLFGDHELEVRVAVAERDLDKGVLVGIFALVRLHQKTLRIPVATVAPVAIGPGRTTEVTIPLPGDMTPAPGHGTSTRVDFVVDEAARTFAVDEKAVAESKDGNVVFVIADGRARAVPVVVGIRDGGSVAVDGELAAGALVAVSNLDLLQDGTEVLAVRAAGEDGVRP